jgi:hypothetical protein
MPFDGVQAASNQIEHPEKIEDVVEGVRHLLVEPFDGLQQLLFACADASNPDGRLRQGSLPTQRNQL